MLAFISRVSSRASKVDLVKKDEETAEPVPPLPTTTIALAPDAPEAEGETASQLPPSENRASVSIYSGEGAQDTPAEDTAVSTAELSTVPATQVSHDPATELKPPTPRPAPVNADKQRRLSWRPLSFRILNNQDTDEHKHHLSAEKEQKKKLKVAEDRAKRAVRVSSADKKARESAILVRSLIIGPSGIALSDAKTKPVSKPKIAKVKSQLLKPKSANRVIAQLRALPSLAETLPDPKTGEGEHTTIAHGVPIHAVCLAYTDTEAEEKHFAKLKSEPETLERSASGNTAVPARGMASVYNSSVQQLEALFADMEIITLLTPDLGLGQPGDAVGILSGAVPTANTILEGVEQITPQLLSLGYATGKAILPDHSGVHPPTDRMSVLTYWWGFEITMPPPSIEYLSKAPSIAHSVINVLTAMSVVNNGVREILPFVRYIASFIDSEWNMIRQEDRGKGVVCAATWLVPVALVPRAWDFTPAPILTIQPALADDPEHPKTPVNAEPTDPPRSPSLPPSRPVSPPTLLPPLEIHKSAFDEPEAESVPDTEPPVDETPVDIDEEALAQTQTTVPVVAVVPPTPTASVIKTGLAPAEEPGLID